MGKAEYRLTVVTTKDYGSSVRAYGLLARIPDGSRWDRLPLTIEVAVPEGTRPGAIFDVSITEREGCDG